MNDAPTEVKHTVAKNHFWLLLVFGSILTFFPVLENSQNKIFFIIGAQTVEETGYSSYYVSSSASSIWNFLLTSSLVITIFTSSAALFIKRRFVKEEKVYAGFLCSLSLSLVAFISLFYYSEFVLISTRLALSKTFSFYLALFVLLVIVILDYRTLRKMIGKKEKQKSDSRLHIYFGLVALCLFVVALFYYVTSWQLDYVDKQKQISQSSTDYSYVKGLGKIRDFQKIGEFGFAVDSMGYYSLTEEYLLAYNYNIPSLGLESINGYREDRQAYFEIDLYQADQGMSSYRKIDVKKIIHDYDEDYIMTISNSSHKSPVVSNETIYQPIEVIEKKDLERKELYLNLKTLKVEEGIKENGKIESYDSSFDLDAYHSEGFIDKLAGLRAVESDSSRLLMLPYQEGVELLLYQEYPHILDMAKKGYYEIKIKDDVNKSRL